jgi:hypothetical protein
MNWKKFAAFAFALLAVVLLSYQPVHAQATIATGSIQGAVTDPQGAGVPTAKVTITNKGTGVSSTAPITSSGLYTSGSLLAGEYVVRIEAQGFKTVEEPVVVQIGNVSTANVKLELGASTTVVEVVGQAVTVNTEQPTIQGVVTSTQIENLPINGRNFLDLAQLEPGVQIQDGGNFDPTKKGFSSVSFGGRFGRTARIEVDGLDISDETVGTTTQNIPMNSIREFQASQSTLDLGTELTSSGTLNVTTKSGTNQFHWGGFFAYRGDATGAAIGNPPAVFNRYQYGAEAGGALIKNKLFIFGSFERVDQQLQGPVALPDPFTSLNGTSGSPFRDTELLGRLDYNINSNIRAFFKIAYEQNKDTASFVPNTYQPFANADNTPSYGGGIDFTTGTFTHSIRVGYLKFRNGISSAELPFGPQNPAPDLSLSVGNGRTSCTASGNLICTGPNILAPQATFQTNKQLKYDGSKVWGTHILRYGIGVNRILGGGFANFFGLAPAVRSANDAAGNNQAFANADHFGPGGDANLLNWPVTQLELGNGEGCFTEIPQFGQPCGGQFDTRFQFYVGDSWKVKPSFTLTYGVRYNRDTGRTDSDLPAVPALNQFQPGLGDPVRQPNHNIGGLIGFAWSPKGDTRTVIRAGAGVYFENGVFNNVLFDRPGRLTQGLFNQVAVVCPSGKVPFPDGSTVTTIDGLNIATQICGNSNAVGNVEQAMVDLQNAYQAATVAAGPQANAAYFGANNTTALTGSMFAPNFRTPRSYQMNVGVQRELKPGTVLSVDYLRNIGLHTLLGIDENHQGDARFLDVPTATAAINGTNADFGCPAGSAGIDCAIGKGATIEDYSAATATHAGLGGGPNATGGFAAGPGTFAFPGINPNYGAILLLEPTGRSVYNALQVVLRSDLKSPVSFVKRMNFQASYSLSRFDSQAQDLDFVNSALNFRNPGQFIGPGSLDRTSQLSAGMVMDLPKGFRMDFITHWYTALPQTITFANNFQEADIFQFDTVGDGQAGIAPVPGSQVGSFGRGIKGGGGLNNFLQIYSNSNGNQITPAGAALVQAGLMSTAQLQGLCAVTPSLNPIGNCAAQGLQLAPAPAGQVGNDALFTFDMTLAYQFRPIRSRENFTVEPQVKFFNLFNHPNYNGPDAILSGVLDNSEGSINGTTKAQRTVDRVNLSGLGSGVFSFGAPRVLEFGIKVNW